MERILFIVPPNITFGDLTKPPANLRVTTQDEKVLALGAVVTDMPLGPITLSAYIRKHSDTETRIIDFNVVLHQLPKFNYQSFHDLFWDWLSKPEYQEFDPTIVGISALFSPAYRNMLDLSECSKQLFPKALILGGGFLPTNFYKGIYSEHQSFDALCFGEGEKALLRLVLATDKQRLLDEDPVWITKSKAQAKAQSSSRIGSIVSISKSGIKKQEFELELIHDLDEVPFLDYDGLDLNSYMLNPTIGVYSTTWMRKGMKNFHVMTSRGCVFRCTFCAQDTVHGRTMRYNSLERMSQDLKRLRDQYGAETIIFEDDHFMGDTKRAYEILGYVIELGMKAFFPNSLALYALKRPMLEQLKAAGVDQLVLAVESGSAEVLHNVMYKPLRMDIISQVTKDCRELGIYSDCNIVLGMPGETEKNFQEAREFLRTTYANWYHIHVATPIVGSAMLEECLDNNYLKGECNDGHYKHAIVETKDFTAARIQELEREFNLDLNFVNNSDFRLGHFETALKGFNNTLKHRPDHAFAHHYAALCYEQLGEPEKGSHHRTQAIVIAQTPFWQNMLEKFPQVQIEKSTVAA
jgi:anaerobic magnesium-protoporphyrin IX monomethyl ester cyclase